MKVRLVDRRVEGNESQEKNVKRAGFSLVLMLTNAVTVLLALRVYTGGELNTLPQIALIVWLFFMTAAALFSWWR